MDWPSSSPGESCRPVQSSEHRSEQVAAPEAQCPDGAAQQQIFQKPNRRRGRPWKCKGTVWSIVCAMNLGLFSESSLKDVSFVNIGDNFMKRQAVVEEMAVETGCDHEKVEAKPKSNASVVWPFMQVARTVILKKAVRKRRNKRRRNRLTINRKKRDTRLQIKDTEKFEPKKKRVIIAAAVAPTTSLDRKKDTDLRNTSGGPPAGLSGYNFSFRRLHARLPGGSKVDETDSSRAIGDKEIRGKLMTQQTNHVTSADHSTPRHAGLPLMHNTRKATRSHASLPKRTTDYYKNVARVDDDMGDIWEDSTSEENKTDEDENDDDEDYDGGGGDDDDDDDDADWEVNATKTTRRVRTRNLANGSFSNHKAVSMYSERLPLRKVRLRSRSASLRNRKAMKRQQNSVAAEDRNTRVIARRGRRRNVARCVTPTSKTHLAERTRKRCECRNPRRRPYNNVRCSCKENMRNTATAILKDIRAQISNTDTDQDTEDMNEVAEDPGESRNEQSNHEDSMKYEWEDEGAPDCKSDSLQNAVSSAKSSLKMYANRRSRGRRRWNKAPIDCKFIDRTETTYQSVLPEHVERVDTTPSLKINPEEMNWASDDRDISALIEPRSSVGEGRDNEYDEVLDALTTATQVVVFDDPEDGEAHQERNALMASACYVYRETPGNNADETAVTANAKTPGSRANLRDPNKDVITYGNRKRSNGKPSSSAAAAAERSFGQEKTQESAKIQVKSTTESNKDCDDSDDEKKYALRRSTRSSIVTTKEVSNTGKLVWGNCSGWWPALIVEADQVGMVSESGKMWVYWIGESQISLLNEKTQIEPFSRKLEERLTQKFRKNNTRSQAIDETIKMLRQRYECTLTKPYYYWIQRNIRTEELDNLCFYPYTTKIQERLDALKKQNAKATEQYMLKQKSGSPEPAKKQVVEKTKDTKAVKQMEDERLPLYDQMPGVITWAKISGHNWWPAMVIDYRDCCLKEPNFGCQWIMWYGDYTVSQVHHLAFLKFHKGIEKLREYIENTKKHVYLVGVLQASKDYCSRLGCNTDNWSLDNVFKYFSDMNNIHVPYNNLQVSESNKVYDKYSNEIIKKMNELKSNPNVDSKRKDDINESDALRRVMAEQSKLEKLCLKCLKFPKSAMEDHPFFEGSLCKECSNQFKPCMFVFGNDDKCFYCTVCAATGTVVICDREDCPRVYCTACLKYLLCPKVYNEMLLEDPWECFLCRDKSTLPVGLLRPRTDWKEKFLRMFRTNSDFVSHKINVTNNSEKKKGIRVLSLFDGLSTGLVVLLKLGIDVEVYYASEIDPNSLTISSAHFGDRITYLGDVRGVTKEKVKEMMPIDLLIGGSPCNDLSLVNPARLGLHNPKGTGILFFEYTRILKQLKKYNKGRHLFWLYENVASMPSEFRLEMNKHLGQEPMVIDSADFSPQHRLRLYWHNLPDDPYFPQFQKQQDVQDILTPNCNRYALVKKIRTVTTRTNSLRQGKAELKPIMMKGTTDTLWITELEEIFGFPRHYTDVKNLSATNRQRLIGKSWSVQTLTAILRPLCSFFKCNEDENGQSDLQREK